MNEHLMKLASIVFVWAVLFVFASGNAAATCKEPTKPALSPGMKVVTPLAGPNWSVGKIESIKGRNVTVKDADGGLGSMKPSEVLPHPSVLYKDNSYPCFKAGDKVIAPLKGNIWRIATITSIEGDKATIAFTDKKQNVVKQVELLRAPK